MSVWRQRASTSYMPWLRSSIRLRVCSILGLLDYLEIAASEPITIMATHQTMRQRCGFKSTTSVSSSPGPAYLADLKDLNDLNIEQFMALRTPCLPYPKSESSESSFYTERFKYVVLLMSYRLNLYGLIWKRPSKKLLKNLLICDS